MWKEAIKHFPREMGNQWGGDTVAGLQAEIGIRNLLKRKQED
jgi:hypothetical protein